MQPFPESFLGQKMTQDWMIYSDMVEIKKWMNLGWNYP